MIKFPKISIFLSCWFAMEMAGCTLPISRELRMEANRNPHFAQVADNPAGYIGLTVLWGGVIKEVRSTSEGTEIQIVQSPLKGDDSPDLEVTGGEFIAITADLMDLSSIKMGERITVVGKIAGERTVDTKIVKYRFPVLFAKEFYLWDRRNRWWEPRPSSGWFWELFGASPQSVPEDREKGVREYEVW